MGWAPQQILLETCTAHFW